MSQPPEKSQPPKKKRRFFHDEDPPDAEGELEKRLKLHDDGTFSIKEKQSKSHLFHEEESAKADQTQQLHQIVHENPPSDSSDKLREQSAEQPTSEVRGEKYTSDVHDIAGSPINHVKNLPDASSRVLDPEIFAGLGINLTIEDLKILEEVSEGDMERAINMYFDGSWKSKSVTTEIKPEPKGLGQFFLKQKQSKEPLATAGDNKLAMDHRPNSGPMNLMPEAKYIGAFGVGGWATRSGKALISHGEKVGIERNRIQVQPISIKKTKGKGKSKAPVAPMSRRKTSDIVVRFTNSKGEEVGRLPQEAAAFVSTLMDQGICSFEGRCVFAEDHIRTNDTVFLQLRCFLLRSAFDHRKFLPSESNRVTDLFAAKETDEERNLRLRQIGLVKLFEEIRLNPSRTNEITAKHKRSGLLQAAEMVEQLENAKAADIDDQDKSNSPSQSASEDNGEGKVLEQDQLDALYRKAQAFDWDSPEMEPAASFSMDLRPYQKQALYWMVNKEKDVKTRLNESIHPLWEEYIWPVKDENDQDLPSIHGLEKFYVNPYSGDLSLDFPRQEQNCLGGILADEMGLGKTIEMLSLIHTRNSEFAPVTVASNSTLRRVHRISNEVEPAPYTTLVVAPMSLLSQWQSEAEKASKPGTLKTLVYYGDDKNVNLQALCSASNISGAPGLIITSYGVVLSEYAALLSKPNSRGESGGLFSVKFFRIILDEGHHIKNRMSKTAKACYELNAEHRWVLTGTPIVNRLEDLFSLVRFLRVEPWSNFSFWRTFITVPFESQDFLRALDVVQTVLEPLVLRRTKEMRQFDGSPLVPLPSKTIIVEEVELSKQERAVYDHIFNRAKRTFAANVDAGTLMKSYTTIFAQILRLRQSCCHPTLVRRKDVVADEEEAAQAADQGSGFADDMDLQDLIERFTEAEEEGTKSANAYGAHILKQIQEEADIECPICSEELMIDQVVTGCFHGSCKKCLLDHIEYQKDRAKVPLCVTCRSPINEREIFQVVRDGGFEENPEETFKLRRLSSRSSAKIEALLSKLKELRRKDSQLKSTVFSQFTSFLDIIEQALNKEKIPNVRFDGSIPQHQRAAAIQKFTEHGGFIVLLISLRAGGVGLNLTCASRVFMMDPWWSFAIEAQAIDRVHRMGQTMPVTVHRFIVKGSVEERMVNKIQARKKFIASSLGMMTDEEKKQQRIEDIRDLLS